MLCYDKNAKKFTFLKLGGKLCVQNYRYNAWRTAKIIRKGKDTRSYMIKTLTNMVYSRNRKHLTLSKGE